jgi:hypothetical protein
MAFRHSQRTAELPPLAALPQPMGMFSNFISDQPQTIAVKEQVFAFGDSFDLQDAVTKMPCVVLRCGESR